MQIALISTDYPPLRTSAAVQMHDLAAALAALGHRAVVIVPGRTGDAAWTLERSGNVEVLRLNADETRAPSMVRRAIAEMKLPFAMLRSLRKSPHRATRWDVVAWYSPPIFFGPLVLALRWRSKARTYLILRDIFPEWAVDLGVMRKGLAYAVLKAVAAFQYAIADVVGVQTPSNLIYMEAWRAARRRIEILHNWLNVTPNIGCNIRISETSLNGRTIFGYIGNMGVAQGMDIFVELIDALRSRQDIGFVFVGRGTELAALKDRCHRLGLDNVLFFEEIDAVQVPGLLSQCHVGIVALHPDHKSHNIPGKFVSYVRYGLPVLARANAGTDLITIIEEYDVGRAYAGHSVDELKRLALELADHPDLREAMSARGRELGASMFSPDAAARQIAAAADNSKSRVSN